MSEYTKGPWEAVDNSWEISSVYAPNGDLVAQCRIHPDVTEDNQEEMETIKEANAWLIAAAPEMFDALKAFIAAEQGVGNPSLSIKAYDKICESALQKALAAVSKAEGLS